MSEYEIRVGGDGIENEADLIVEEVVDLQINSTASAISDFSATVAKTPELRQYLQETVYVAQPNVNEVAWYGTLESWEETETGATTVISGRGPLLDDSEATVAPVTYTNSFADDALFDYIGNAFTDFETVTKDQDVRVKQEPPTFDGAGTTGTISNVAQLPAYQDRQFTEWDVYVQFNEAISSTTIGIGDDDTGADESQTFNPDENETNFTAFNLTTDTEQGDPYTYVDVPTSSAEIELIAVIPSNVSQSFIFSQEVDGSILDGIQTLSELAGYRFGPRNFDAIQAGDPPDTHLLFPIGHEIGEPSWRVLNANRASDYAGYANSITVSGDGNFSVTVKDEEEISTVGKEIGRFVRRDDAKTEADARAIAKTILSSAVQNRGETGSITTSIPDERADATVGATTPISVWNSTFNDGGMVGPDALHFNEPDAVPRISDFGFSSSTSIDMNFNIYVEMDKINEPRYIFSTGEKVDKFVLHPDGSLQFKEDNQDVDIRTDAGVILNETTQTVRLNLVGGTNGTAEIYVDGIEVASYSGQFAHQFDGGIYIGNRRRVPGDDNPTRVSDDQLLHLSVDAVTRTTSPDGFTSLEPDYPRSFDWVTQTETEGTEYTFLSPEESAYRAGIEFGSTDGLEYPDDSIFDLGDSDKSISFSLKVPSSGGTEPRPIWQKGDAESGNEGYTVYLDAGGSRLLMDVHDGTSGTTYILAEVVENEYAFDEWNHFSITMDRNGTLGVNVNGRRIRQIDFTEWQGVNISNADPVQIGDDGVNGVLFHLDELRVHDKVLSASEIDTLAELNDNYRDDFVGGFDEFEAEIDGTRSIHWRFDDDDTPNTAIDTENDLTTAINATIYNIPYAATMATAQEITYNLTNDASADVKFDIGGRVDTELANVRSNVENIKK